MHSLRTTVTATVADGIQLSQIRLRPVANAPSIHTRHRQRLLFKWLIRPLPKQSWVVAERLRALKFDLPKIVMIRV